MADRCLGSRIFDCAETGDLSRLLHLLQTSSQGQVHSALRWRRKWRLFGPYRELDGRNALSVAAENGHLEVVQTLFSYNALDVERSDCRTDVDSGNIINGSLFYALKTVQHDVVRALLNAGADASRDRLFHALVHWSSPWSFPSPELDSTIVLLKDKMDIDQVDVHGHTALMLACGQGKIRMASLLLQCGADPNVQSPDGRTAEEMVPAKFAKTLRGNLLTT